jgi:hypothetical protein
LLGTAKPAGKEISPAISMFNEMGEKGIRQPLTRVQSILGNYSIDLLKFGYEFIHLFK